LRPTTPCPAFTTPMSLHMFCAAERSGQHGATVVNNHHPLIGLCKQTYLSRSRHSRTHTTWHALSHCALTWFLTGAPCHSATLQRHILKPTLTVHQRTGGKAISVNEDAGAA
jgi:hypothetical protein